MTKACEHCGMDNPAAANFCRRCGKPASAAWLRSATQVGPVMQQWRRLRQRLTRKEVRAILGEPARVETGAPGAAVDERWIYKYERPGEAAEKVEGRVDFALPDGIVQAWSEPEWPVGEQTP